MKYRITTQKEKYSSEQSISVETNQRTAIGKYTILAEENYFCLLEMGTGDIWERVDFRINDRNGNRDSEAEVRYILSHR